MKNATWRNGLSRCIALLAFCLAAGSVVAVSGACRGTAGRSR